VESFEPISLFDDSDEVPWSPDDFVVYGGLSALEVLRQRVLTHHELHGTYALSAYIVPGAVDVLDAARQTPMPHPRVRGHKVGMLGSLDLTVVADPQEGEPGDEFHVLVQRDDGSVDFEVERLEQLMCRVLEK